MTFYNHKTQIHTGNILREIVFGMEDGMVSTLGSLTGVAIGSQNKEAVILAGFVIIAVESISMGIGSFISNQTKQSSDKRIIAEEKIELRDYPKEEYKELEKMLIKEGWSKSTTAQMMQEIVGNEKLMLKEMEYRELQISSEKPLSAIKSGIYMFSSYVLGGFVPLATYIIFQINKAPLLSIISTLLGLFMLGTLTTKFTKEKWYKSGFRVLIVGSIAMIVGLIVGKIFSLTN